MISALGRLRQGDHHKPWAVTQAAGQPGVRRETLSQETEPTEVPQMKSTRSLQEGLSEMGQLWYRSPSLGSQPMVAEPL